MSEDGEKGAATAISLKGTYATMPRTASENGRTRRPCFDRHNSLELVAMRRSLVRLRSGKDPEFLANPGSSSGKDYAEEFPRQFFVSGGETESRVSCRAPGLQRGGINLAFHVSHSAWSWRNTSGYSSARSRCSPISVFRLYSRTRSSPRTLESFQSPRRSAICSPNL